MHFNWTANCDKDGIVEEPQQMQLQAGNWPQDFNKYHKYLWCVCVCVCVRSTMVDAFAKKMLLLSSSSCCNFCVSRNCSNYDIASRHLQCIIYALIKVLTVIQLSQQQQQPDNPRFSRQTSHIHAHTIKYEFLKALGHKAATEVVAFA